MINDNNQKQITNRNPQQEIRDKGGMGAKPLPSKPFSILNLEDFIETVEVAPTAVPKSFYESIKLVVDDLTTPTTYHLYIFSRELNIWLKFTGAAA